MRLLSMSDRQAGGLQRQGRYKKDDTTRKLFINTVALPGLRTGVLPTISDEKMLFLGPMDNPNLKPEEREELKCWGNTVNRDPRARQRPAELDVKRQSTLLDWARQNAQFCFVPKHTEGHFESGYKVSFGRYKDRKISDLVTEAQKTGGGTRAGGSSGCAVKKLLDRRGASPGSVMTTIMYACFWECTRSQLRPHAVGAPTAQVPRMVDFDAQQR